MIKKLMMLALAITVFMVVPALADQDCSSGNFVGTYLRVDPATDVFGDGTEVHQYVYQLTLNSDGTATQYWTGLPDYMINAGTGSPNIGSWKCKNNGKLLVTLLGATYVPTTPSVNAPNPDITLYRHYRYMYLFTIDNNKTMSRVKARVKKLHSQPGSKRPRWRGPRGPHNHASRL